MNLPRETSDFITWLYRVLRQFIRTRPGATLVVIGASAFGRVTQVLVFFLPLKVILLVASDGVPRYFPVADDAEKMAWVIGLSIGAFAAYVLTLLLDTLSARLSTTASIEVLQGANEMTILSQQDEVAKDAYTGTCQLVASALFVAVVGLVLMATNQLLLAFLVTMVLAQYAFTAYVMRDVDDDPGTVKTWISENESYYLRILASVNFLGAFLIVLAPFLLTGQGNVIVAVLGIVLARQGLNTLVPTVKNALNLNRRRHRIDALVFRKAHLKRQAGDQSLYIAFDKPRRQRRTTAILGDLVDLQGDPDVHWVDSPVNGIATLLITEPPPRGRRFQQQIFSAKQAYRLANEEFLFQHIPRDKLRAPAVVSRFSQGPFECQICHYGTGQRPTPREWAQVERDLLIAIWGCRPPKRLVTAYRASHPLLYQRLQETFVQQLRVAVDTGQDRARLDRLLAALPAIRDRLRAMPLVVHNPDLNRSNVVLADTGYQLTTWARWSLEPLGSDGSNTDRRKLLIEALPALRKQRRDIAVDFDERDVELAAQCRRLESHITRHRYKAGLQAGARILRNGRLAEALKVA